LGKGSSLGFGGDHAGESMLTKRVAEAVSKVVGATVAVATALSEVVGRRSVDKVAHLGALSASEELVGLHG
jgi:hypothetical protein